MGQSGWRLTGELSPNAAEEFENDLERFADARGLVPPTMSRFEQAGETLWRVDIYFAEEPNQDFLTALLEEAGHTDWAFELGPLEDRDWVSESQKLLSPVRAGRFFVFGSHDADKANSDLINLQIDAGQAFGTGKHETTSACLSLLDGLVGKAQPRSVLDIGTGSAVLALAAAKAWPEARVTATDIDPVAVDVSRENCSINNVVIRSPNDQEPGIALLVADGLDDPELVSEQPYDVVFANILAGPLIDMASTIAASVERSGILVLSGLLINQKPEVLEAYTDHGMELVGECMRGEWAALQLHRK